MSRVNDLREKIFGLETDLICCKADITHAKEAIDSIVWELGNAHKELNTLGKEEVP